MDDTLENVIKVIDQVVAQSLAHLKKEEDEFNNETGSSEFDPPLSDPNLGNGNLENAVHSLAISLFHSFINITDDLFQCSQCSFKTKWKHHAKRHVLTHSEKKLLKCPYCEYDTNRIDKFKQHLAYAGNHKPNKTRKRLKPRNEKPKQEVISLVKSFDLEKPMTEKEIDSVIDIIFGSVMMKSGKDFTCSHCTYETTKIRDAKRHSLTHSGTKVLRCQDCDFRTNRKDKFKQHCKKHDPLLIESNASKRVKQDPLSGDYESLYSVKHQQLSNDSEFFNRTVHPLSSKSESLNKTEPLSNALEPFDSLNVRPLPSASEFLNRTDHDSLSSETVSSSQKNNG